VRDVYFGIDGILEGVRPHCVLVDMTTTEPSLAREIDAAARAKGAHAVDAPVSGGDVGARNATLSIMIGGDAPIVERLLPLFELIGKNIVHQGPAGSGQHTKMCNQILVAGTMIGVCESLLYAIKLGLDQQAVIDIISKGAAGSWSISNLGPRLVRGDFKTGFLVRHFIKDMGIALQEAAAVDLSMPGLALVHQLYVAVMAQGHRECTTQALYLALKSLNGMK